MRPVAAEAATDDPFKYGWRYVKRTLPDGTVEFDQVPLTLEDVLHPQEGDVIPENHFHQLTRDHLADVFRTRPLGPPAVAVTSDLLVDWGIPDLRAHSPDLAVFVGLRQALPLDTGTIHLAALGGRCLLALEVVSPATRENDVVHKMGHYHRAAVPLYVLIDQEKEGGPRRLSAYRYQPGGYEPVTLDAQGRLLVGPLGLFLLLREERVLCVDAGTGRELGDYERLARELEEADRRNREQELAIEEAVEGRAVAERGRLEAEKGRSEAEKGRSAAEDRAREQALAHEEAERKARDEARAREEAERKAQDEVRAREEAERQARDHAERARLAEERLQQMEALLKQFQARPGEAP